MQVTLEAAETKTHREIHSLWGVFAATHRVVLLHLVLFFAGVCRWDAPLRPVSLYTSPLPPITLRQ